MAQETQPITYQQLLADVFDENARNRLVDAQEYEEEEVDPYDIDKYSENEVDDHEDFNKFQGDLNTPEHVIKVAPAVGGTTTYGYNKDVRTTVLNIDGKFRVAPTTLAARITSYNQCLSGALSSTAYQNSSSTQFLVGLGRQYKNVSSVKIITMEFENSFNAFSGVKTLDDGTSVGRENTSFAFLYYVPGPTDSPGITNIVYSPDANGISMVWDDYYTVSRVIVIALASDPGTPLVTITDSDTQYWTGPSPAFPHQTSFHNQNLSSPGPYVVTLTLTNSSGSTSVSVNTIVIPDGNYALTGTNALIPTILSQISTVCTTNLPSGWNFTNLNIVQDPYSFRLSFKWDHSFSLQFPRTTDCFTQNGIGYNLGFYNIIYISYANSGVYQIDCDTRPDLIPDRYVFLVVNDWYQIQHQYADQTQLGAFLKIPLTVPKYEIQYDNISLDTITKEYFFPLPINIQKLEISVVDSYGKLLDMNGGSFSMSLAISEVLQPGIYENLLKM